MARASFMQTSFLGGLWSPSAQGRMDNPAYKTALNENLNYIVLEEGGLGRRPGFKKLGITRHGLPARLMDFDFSYIQPYQMEFTDSFLRLWAGQVLVETSDVMQVATITADNPAKVYLTAPCPLSNGDSVFFNLNSAPCSAPLLCGQQYRVAGVSGSTFTLQDAVTGANIDGATLDYQPPATTLDTVSKIYEIATDYTEDMLPDLRKVQDLDSVMLLHGDVAPAVLGGDAPFTLSDAVFVDGPYLDINATDTTLTLSGRSGSVTVTASAIAGINDDTGFKTTDVGRLIRFQGGPAEWNVGTTYGKFQRVTGSDGQVYYSVISGNIGNDPTTDSGTHWLPSIIVVTWTWLQITAWSSTTVVTATIMGTALTATDSLVSDAWRLGLFSDTTGWPTCGAYHEGRVWLAGVIKNRVDGGTANNLDPGTGKAMAKGSFCFQPTDTDGAVNDANAVSAVPNAAEADVVEWMSPDAQGLVLGTQSGEWSVRASSLDDPITPTSIQMRKVTTAGCANAEPVWAWEKFVFIQREQHKVVEHSANSYLGPSRYYYDNLSHLVDTLMAPGVAEIKWQQEPLLTVWARMQDGSLNGFFYKKPQFRLTTNEESLGSVSWHRHVHGQGRSFESLSTGPSGLGSTGLYAVTNQTDEDASDFGIRYVETLTPVFNAGVDDCAAFFVDSGAVPCCTEKKAISNGDTFDGLRIWGFNLLDGQVVQPFLGGIDVGDFTVSSGHIDIPWATTGFTELYFDSLGSCDLTGATGTQRVDTTQSPTNTGGLIAYVGAASTVDYATTGGDMMVAHDTQKFFLRQVAVSGNNGIMRFDSDTDVEEQEATETDIFGAGPAHTFSSAACCYGNGYIYATGIDGLSNSAPIAKIDASTLQSVAIWGASGSSLSQSTTSRIVLSFGMAAAMTTGNNRYLASCGLRAANVLNEVAILNADGPDGSVPLLYAAQIDETHASVCAGKQADSVSFFVFGSNIIGSAIPDAVGVYEFWCEGATVTRRKIGTIAPTDVDATWTNFSQRNPPGYDQADGNILALFETTDSVTNKKYLAKINAITGAVMWTCPVNNTTSMLLNASQFNGTYEYYDYSASPSRHSVVQIDLSDGSVNSTTAWNAGLVLEGAQIYGCHSGTITHSGALTLNVQYGVSGTPVPIYLGEYLAAHSDTIPAHRHGRIFNGSVCPTHDDLEFPFYGVVGFTYTSRAQLLRPDFGEDAGTRAGPAFAKKRRLHKYAAALIRTLGIKFGTNFSKLNAAPLARTGEGWTAASEPNLFTDTVKVELNDDFSYSGQICWEQTRPYPGTIVAIGGFIESED